MIALVLLIGIVKKNAIMMIDFALVAQREHGLAPREAAREASIVRFRPIMMTTMVAIRQRFRWRSAWAKGPNCVVRWVSR